MNRRNINRIGIDSFTKNKISIGNITIDNYRSSCSKINIDSFIKNGIINSFIVSYLVPHPPVRVP